MQKRFRYKHFRGVLAAVLSVACLAPPMHKLADLPDDIALPQGQATVLPLNLPIRPTVVSSNSDVADAAPVSNDRGTDVRVQADAIGETRISTTLFGWLPWKSMHVHVVPQEVVVVGGQSIGVRLHSNGVLVVGFQRVREGSTSPALRAHLHVGDLIVAMNGRAVRTADDVRQIASTSQGPVEVDIRRGNDRVLLTVDPDLDDRGTRRIGVFVREKTSGVGTLTFYDPVQHRFGALGHVITDADTGQPIVGTGSLFEAEVTGVVRGASGKPGEKRGRFVGAAHAIGHVEKNSDFGVFGSMEDSPSHAWSAKQLPVALPNQVHEGDATLLTVLHGQRVQSFKVEVESVTRQNEPTTKSMVIHVTDPRLLEETGGIVQGMSGSPLIQDGRLIGAVTHVFVSDPTRGYGVYAEWMVRALDDSERDAVSRVGKAFAKAAVSPNLNVEQCRF